MASIEWLGVAKQVSDEMAELFDQYNKEYAFLYDHYDRVAGYSEALDFGDQMIRNHHPLVAEFVAARQDPLTSDREVAAFAFAACELGYI